MCKRSLILVLSVHLVLAQLPTPPKENKVSQLVPNANISSNSTSNTKIDQVPVNNEINKSEVKGEVTEIKHDESEVINPEGDLDQYNFKYYYVLLVLSSCTIIGIIIFRSFK
jgi:hypothetical protein